MADFVRVRHRDLGVEARLPADAMHIYAPKGWELAEGESLVDVDRTIPEVLAEVGDDPAKALDALQAEKAGAARTTLLDRLQQILDRQ